MKTKVFEPKIPYVYICMATDQHWGGRSKVWLWDSKKTRFLGLADGAFELMRRAGYGEIKPPPFQVFTANDDWVQGQHFAAHQQPHQEELPYYIFAREIHRRVQALSAAKSDEERTKLSAQLEWFILHQKRIAGVDATGAQADMVLREHLMPNLDIFSGMLKRAYDRKVIIRGEQEILGIPYSSRDLGVWSSGTGNHFLKTVDGHVPEGPIYANYMRLLLRALDLWRDKDEFLERYIRAPIMGKEFKSYGTLQIPGGYEYGLEFRDTPAAKGVDWGDPVRTWIRNDLKRGNPSRIFTGQYILKTCGDKHFFSYSRTNHALYLMGPASTETDLYGELGFPPNNSGIVFLGVPAEHPDAGPILIRPLFYRQLKDYLDDNPRPFDWESFLPNAA